MRKYALISIIMVAMLLNACLAPYAGAAVYYSVRPGDTLYGIGKKFGLGYPTIMKDNRLSSALIVPGLKLRIPAGEAKVHTVRQAETLFGISRNYGVRITDIKAANGLNTALIRPGMRLVIPVSSRQAAGQIKPVFGGKISVTKEDINHLARLIYAEARGESLEGQIAVGAVIMNRLYSESFPGTIRDIIYQRTNGVYQFTPVQDGQIRLRPNSTAYYAAERALKGDDPTGNALFFYNPETSSDEWIRTLPVTKIIGNHVFAK